MLIKCFEKDRILFLNGGMHEYKKKDSNKLRTVVSKVSSLVSDPVDKTRGILKSDEYILLETCRDKLYANF